LETAFNVHNSSIESLKALLCALWHRDSQTQRHSTRIIDLSEALGVACNLSTKEIYQLRFSACLHDIGKIGIPDDILLKPGKFDACEWDVMKSHSEKGEDIVRSLDVEGSETAALVVRHHHEHFNGKGYPDKLSGEDIPVLSRIIGITDSFDAMADVRCYHQARTQSQILDVMNSEHGKFDPWMLRKFEQLVSVNCAGRSLTFAKL